MLQQSGKKLDGVKSCTIKQLKEVCHLLEATLKYTLSLNFSCLQVNIAQADAAYAGL